MTIFHFLLLPLKLLEMIEISELFTCSCPVPSESFNICDLCSLHYGLLLFQWYVYHFRWHNFNSLRHFALYTRSCWLSNLLLSLIWKQVLSFLPVYTIWVCTVSGSSWQSFSVILLYYQPFSLYTEKRFLLFGTSSCDELVGNCCQCYSCGCWWLLGWT